MEEVGLWVYGEYIVGYGGLLLFSLLVLCLSENLPAKLERGQATQSKSPTPLATKTTTDNALAWRGM